MTLKHRAAAAGALLIAVSAGSTALAQKQGGILKIPSADSPASMSILEDVGASTQGPMMGVFNNLVMFDQHVKQNSLGSIVPDLATSWSWNEDGTELTFSLRQGVRWHDGRPFTAKDVQCTWDLLLEQSSERLRVNPRKSFYRNVEAVNTTGSYEVIFHLRRAQPAFPMLLADGNSPIYPCHVSPTQMRKHPIGTGPFKFVEFRPNESIKVTRNQEYWKPNRPYLDGIEYTIIPSLATRMLAFTAGKLDIAFLGAVLSKDVQNQMPQATCELTPNGINRHLIVNRDKPPFDSPDLRRAMALSVDRQAFINTIGQGEGDIGGVLQPPPGGLWGMPPDQLRQLPGYDPDVQKNRAEARTIMEKLGYGPDSRLKIKVSTRDLPVFRDPAVILIDQLKEVYVDGELDPIDGALYYPKIRRKDYIVGLNLQEAGPDPDPILDVLYGCRSTLNWDAYCSPEVERLIEQQSMEGDPERRKQLLWAIERKLAEDDVRPIIFYSRAGICRQPWVKGLTIMVNSIFNGNRREDIWLDK